MTSSAEVKFGSPEWADLVFSEPPAREVKSRTMTSRPRLRELLNGSTTYVQGDVESTALSLIEYLWTLGYIARFKTQPFWTNEEEFGARICPDFFVEAPGIGFVVIEVKTKRYLTLEKQHDLDRNAESFARFNLKYLVWTNETPLTSVLGHLFGIARVSVQPTLPVVDIDSLVKLVDEKGSLTVDDIRKAGFDRTTIYAGFITGKIFIPLGQKLTLETMVTKWEQNDFCKEYLGCTATLNSWWDSL